MRALLKTYRADTIVHVDLKKVPDDWDGKDYEALDFCVGSNQEVIPLEGGFSLTEQESRLLKEGGEPIKDVLP
jgi:hypothetical protein